MIHDLGLHYRLIPFLAHELQIHSYLELGQHEGTITRVMVEMGVLQVVGVDKNFKPEAEGLWSFQMTTEEFLAFPIRTFPKFDMVFIDADHTDTAVEKDFYGVLPYVHDNGLILMHDTLPLAPKYAVPEACGTAYRFAAKLRSNDEFESCTVPFSPGLTIVRKRKSQVPWEDN
jgi:methyltransferase family protein